MAEAQGNSLGPFQQPNSDIELSDENGNPNL
jgi:hypothetical protein